MPTQWTNEISSGSPIRAFDIQELREAIDCNRSAYGEGPYPWTDVPVTSTTPIRAVHFTEACTSIQGLWDKKTMGTLPGWTGGVAPATGSPILASHLNDLRSWVNQYETDPTGAVYSSLRGLHLRNGSDMRPEDVTAASMFDPRLVVVLSGDVLSANTLSYLKSLSASVEIFCRRWPTTYPPKDYTTLDGYNSWQLDDQGNIFYGGDGAAAVPLTGEALAQDIVNLFDTFKNTHGLTITRWYPGNEPELEWLSDARRPAGTWYPHTWDDMSKYYKDVYDRLQLIKGTRPIELYIPAFASFSSVGVGNYWADGSVSYFRLSPTGPVSVPSGYNWQFGDRGYDHVKVEVIEHYTNGTGVGRVNWHSYFWPGRQDQQSAFLFMPNWLQDHITLNGYPSRITEYGWIPDCFSPPCSANLDTTTGPCEPPPKSLTSWGDYNDFVRLRANASGIAVWILSSASSQFEPSCAVDSAGNIRPWFKKFACILNANL